MATETMNNQTHLEHAQQPVNRRIQAIVRPPSQLPKPPAAAEPRATR